MEFHFNYNPDIVNHYVPLLISTDYSVRSTAIVDLIMQKVYTEYPFEFCQLMTIVNSTYLTTDPNEAQYIELRRALYSYEQISALKMREDIDKLLNSVFTDSGSSRSHIDYLSEEVGDHKMLVNSLQQQVNDLTSKIEFLRGEINNLHGYTHSLQFRIDNGMYETRG
jgi:ribosome-interacting GTPase 1